MKFSAWEGPVWLETCFKEPSFPNVCLEQCKCLFPLSGCLTPRKEAKNSFTSTICIYSWMNVGGGVIINGCDAPDVNACMHDWNSARCIAAAEVVCDEDWTVPTDIFKGEVHVSRWRSAGAGNCASRWIVENEDFGVNDCGAGDATFCAFLLSFLNLLVDGRNPGILLKTCS